MGKRNSFFIIFFVLFFASCEEQLPRVGYLENSCIKETNEKYRNIADLGETVYRLEQIKMKGLIVSVWHGNEWYFQGTKDLRFFQSTKNFKYDSINCPDNKGRQASLSSRIKSK